MTQSTSKTMRTGRLAAISALMITTAIIHPALAQQTVLLVGGGGGGGGAGGISFGGGGGGATDIQQVYPVPGKGGTALIPTGGGQAGFNVGYSYWLSSGQFAISAGWGGIGAGEGGARNNGGPGANGAGWDAYLGYTLANPGFGGQQGTVGTGGIAGKGGGNGGEGFAGSTFPGGGTASPGGSGGGGAGSSGVLTPNASSSGSGPNGGNGDNAVYTVDDSENYAIISLGGGGGGGGGNTSNNGPAVLGYGPNGQPIYGGNGGNGGNGTLIINGVMTSSSSVILGGQGGQGSLFGKTITGTLVITPSNGSNGGNGGNGGNGTITLNGVLKANRIVIGNAGGNTCTSTNAPPSATSTVGGAGGNGSLNIMNGGQLVLTGATSLVQTGPQAYANSGVTSGTGAVNLSGAAAIEVDTGNTGTITAPIDNLAGAPAGILTKNGGGTVVITNPGSYTGGTTINGGVLQVGTTSSPVSNYNPSSNGPLAVLLAPSGAAGSSATTTVTPGNGSLQVVGSAQLSGPLTLGLLTPTAGQHYSIGTTYRVVTATDGIKGTFSNINLTGPYAAYLQASPDYNTPDSISVRLDPTADLYRSGSFYASNAYAQNSSLFAVLAAPSTSGTGYWMHGLGGFGHIVDANYNYKGFVVGHGVALGPHLIVGGGASNIYTHTQGLNGSSVDGTNVGGLLYAIYTLPKWTLSSSVMAGHLEDKSTRNMPGFGRAKFNTDGYYTGTALQAQYNWVEQTHWFATPDAGLSYLHTYMGHGHESGLGAFDMEYGANHSNLVQTSFGLTGGYKTLTRHGILTAWTRLGGIGTLGNPHIRIQETIGGDSGGVTSEAASAAALTPSFGLELGGRTLPWKLAAGWNGQFTKRAAAQNFTLKGSFKF